jgi:hypothetical protein
LVEQWIVGIHTTPKIVTAPGRFAWIRVLVVCFDDLPPADLLDDGETDDPPPPEGVPPPVGAIAPPTPVDAADPSGGWASVEQTRQSVRSAALTALEVDRLWTAALATNHPSYSRASGRSLMLRRPEPK